MNRSLGVAGSESDTNLTGRRAARRAADREGGTPTPPPVVTEAQTMDAPTIFETAIADASGHRP
jgi:hypothetical protein